MGLTYRDSRVLSWTPLLLLPLTGCVANYGSEARNMTHAANAAPSPGAQTAPGKWEGPWKEYSAGSNLKATFYYGPWQCNRRWMASCQLECAEQGRTLKGCMWLADIKYDWKGAVMPIQAGSRYALWHCCCDFIPLTKEEKKPLREQWEARMDSLRKRWGDIYGEWPKTGGVNWPGHHIRDLHHGGHPTDLGNIVPVRPDIHAVLNKQYPACYQGSAPWNSVGPDLPYTDK